MCRVTREDAHRRWRDRRWWSYTPWGAAARVYGRYGLPEGDLAVLGGGVLSQLGPVLEVVLHARAWLTLNLVALVVQLVVDGADDVVGSIYTGGLVTMVVGPFGVVLTVAVLVAVARARRVALRRLARPAVTAVLTLLLSVGVFGIQLPGVRQELESVLAPVVALGDDFPLSMIAPLLGLWLFVFGVCAVYLIHVHAFRVGGTGGERLLDPLVSVWLAWTVAIGEIANYDAGDLSSRTFTVLTIASAAAATAISAGELVVLHRRGITFRAAWSA
jgi:hypothetical protein